MPRNQHSGTPHAPGFRPGNTALEPALRAVAVLALVALACAASVALPGRAAAQEASSDASAIALADSVMQGLGGRAAWDAVGYIAFDFVVHRDTTTSRRSLRWDRRTNRIRVDAKDSKGRMITAWTDLAKSDGRVTVDGAPADTAMRRQWIDRAYAIWVNDTYWLLMPYKLRDPGVILQDAGVDSSGRYRRLHLSFRNVGLTPGDQYWVWVDPATGLVPRWEMLLQGNKDGVPKPAEWTGWARHAGVMLADHRVFPDGSLDIRFENLTVLNEPPAGALD